MHLCLGVPGFPQAHRDRYALAVLDTILGSGMSSRLFQEIREERGLAYSISTYHAAYRDVGAFVVYAGTSPTSAREVVHLVLENLARARDGLDAAEIARAKESLKGSLMLDLETPGSRMSKLARSEQYFGRQLSLDEIIGAVEAVGGGDVRRVAGTLFVPDRVTFAAIGPFDEHPGLAGSLEAEVRQHAGAWVLSRGAAGRMGRAAVRAVARREDMRLVGALGQTASVGQDAGVVAGIAALGVPIERDLAALLAGARPTVLVDLSRGEPAAAHAEAALAHRVPVVIGATGLGGDAVARLRDRARAERVGVLLAPNFALGALLMMEFAQRAARFFPHVEITELHHDRKRDAPSGTAVRTARLIADARGAAPAAAVGEVEMVPGARGGLVDGVRVHSVRLPTACGKPLPRCRNPGHFAP